MAGLIKNRMAQGDQDEQQEGLAPGEQDTDEAQEGAEGSPQEEQQDAGAGAGGASQQDYERVVMAASKMLHQPQVINEIVKMVKTHGDPVQGLADAVLFVMKILWQASKGTMPQAVIVPAGKEVLQMIAAICEHAGLFKSTPKMLEQAGGVAAQKFLQSKGVPQDQWQKLAQQGGGQQPGNFQPVTNGG